MKSRDLNHSRQYRHTIEDKEHGSWWISSHSIVLEWMCSSCPSRESNFPFRRRSCIENHGFSPCLSGRLNFNSPKNLSRKISWNQRVSTMLQPFNEHWNQQTIYKEICCISPSIELSEISIELGEVSIELGEISNSGESVEWVRSAIQVSVELDEISNSGESIELGEISKVRSLNWVR